MVAALNHKIIHATAWDYSTESDSVCGLQARDAAVERWLNEEVAPVYDRVAAGTEPLVFADDVLSEAAERYRARKAKTAKP